MESVKGRGESLEVEAQPGTIKTRGLRKSYKADGGEIRALDGVDVDIRSGEFVSIMGPSGCGKSTLLHTIGALDTPDEGEVLVGGVPLSGLSRAELALVRRRRIGFVFQFFNLLPVLTVEENVSFPATLDGTSRVEHKKHVTELLEAFRLMSHRRKRPSELSGGEQQRVAIARALINRPDVVLADEPTGNLDRASGAEVMALLRDCSADGQTLVVVTHDAVVASSARRVIFMQDGRLVDEMRLRKSGQTKAVLAKIAQLEAD